LPHQHLPFSGFLTLSTVYSRLNLVALFHATSARRIRAFKAFPAQSAVVPLSTRCSLAVSRSLDFKAFFQLSVRSYIAACYRFVAADAFVAFIPFEVYQFTR
jgi:hypothetical protein